MSVENVPVENIKIMKFGGSSLTSLTSFERVAKRIAREQSAGFSPLVVVSAMAHETDELTNFLSGIYKPHPPMDGSTDSERATLLATGEQKSAALLAMTLNQMGRRSRSFQAWQIPIRTDRSGKTILSIGTAALLRNSRQGVIPVVTGFQGITPDHQLSVLPRGGSDITAVWIAKALGVKSCHFYKDVRGVYERDPKKHFEINPLSTTGISQGITKDPPEVFKSQGRLFQHLSYRKMQSLASAGAEVLHYEAIRLAEKEQIHLHVGSTFHNQSGTVIAPATKGEDYAFA